MRIKPNCITTWPSLGRTRRGSIEYRPVKFATRFKYRSSPNDTRESGPQPDFRGYILKHCKQWFSTRIDARESFHIPPSTKEISQQSEKRRITLDIHGRVYTVDSLKLRDACTCKLCVDASTTQKLFSTTDIPGQIRAGLGQVYPDGSFSVSWSSDVPGIEGHSSRYPPGFLATRMGCGSIENRARREIPRIPWGRRGLKESQITFHYDSYLNDPLTCRAVTESLMRYGMAYIAFVPPDPGSVGHIASRIGSIMRTIYGETWDVRSVESPKNVADRDSDINFHMVCFIRCDAG